MQETALTDSAADPALPDDQERTSLHLAVHDGHCSLRSRTLYRCPAQADGKPEPADFDPRHMNWLEVTVPSPHFLDRVNELFGTTFQPVQFARR